MLMTNSASGTSAVDEELGMSLEQLSSRLSGLTPQGKARRFVVARMGSTGSTWLAKLLNAHPDVLCSHEGIIGFAYPSKTYRLDDILTFLEYLAWDTKHDAYAAIGDVGSVGSGMLPELKITTGLLTRHPARILATRLEVVSSDHEDFEIPHRTVLNLEQFWRIDLESVRPVDRIFLHDLCTFVMQLRAASGIHTIIQIERMQDINYCCNALRALTGVDYPYKTIRQSLTRRENERSGKAHRTITEIVDGFSDDQQTWYDLILRDAIRQSGYDLYNDVAL